MTEHHLIQELRAAVEAEYEFLQRHMTAKKYQELMLCGVCSNLREARNTAIAKIAEELGRVEGPPKMTEAKEIVCPFCGEQDFDAPGLKKHLLVGWCEVFEKVERV